MEGRAIDIRLPGRDLKTLYQAALSLQAGGFGYYPGQEFIHVDVGPYRRCSPVRPLHQPVTPLRTGYRLQHTGSDYTGQAGFLKFSRGGAIAFSVQGPPTT
jgi:hypothetical protein